MDCTIPIHNLKKFSASIACLGKIGKDLYISFDPIDGLTLSSLNEAKSAYSKFHFEPGFFDRCNAPPPRSFSVSSSASALRRITRGENGDEERDSRYVCRVPVRSVHSVLRPRKGVCSLRIRSEGLDESGNYLGLGRRRRRERSHSRSDVHSEEESPLGEGRRVTFSGRRSRKRRKREKTIVCHSATRSDHNGQQTPRERALNIPDARSNDKMMLSFEFYIERPANTNGVDASSVTGNGGFLRVLHRIGVTDANGVTLSATTKRSNRSEIVSGPKLWLSLLDPLRKTAEVALTVDDELRVVTATSFHPGEMGREDNAVLLAAAARSAVLKTETSTACDEFDEYDFRTNRGKKRRNNRNRDDDNDSDDDQVDANEEGEKEEDQPPDDVNQKVILVFGIKEAKAMLQFCSQVSSGYHDDGEAFSVFSFHWGGRPIVIETEGDFFTAELVLATLHHTMITSNVTVGVGNRRVSTSRNND